MAAYTRNFTSEDDAKEQKAIATYTIDKLALNAGTEKVQSIVCRFLQSHTCEINSVFLHA